MHVSYTNTLTEDTGLHEEVPMFIKNLLECQTIYREVAHNSEDDKSSHNMDMWGDVNLPLGVQPKKWMLCVSQRYVIDYFLAAHIHYVSNLMKLYRIFFRYMV